MISMNKVYLHRAIFEAKLNELERLFRELMDEIIKGIRESDDERLSEMDPMIDLLILSVSKMRCG